MRKYFHNPRHNATTNDWEVVYLLGDLDDNGRPATGTVPQVKCEGGFATQPDAEGWAVRQIVQQFLLRLSCVLVLLLASCTSEPENSADVHYCYYGITTPSTETLLNGMIYCDSVATDGYCITYWEEGRQGRICGEYTLRPL